MNRFGTDTGGAVALEFAIVSVAFIVLTIGVIEFGRAFQIRNELSFAADYGARHILLDPAADTTSVATVIREKFGVDDENLIVTIGSETLSGVAYRTLDVSYPMQIFVPFVDGALMLSVTRRTPRI